MFFRSLMLTSLVTMSGSTYAASTVVIPDRLDVTNDFYNYLNAYWVNSASSADNVWDNTFCAVPNPLGGCVQKGGFKIYGTASGSVKYLESSFGKGWVITTKYDPWSGIAVPDHWIDLKMTWYYDGDSQGRKQCYPGDYFCGYEWESLHPTGRIIATFKGDGRATYIEMGYEVLQGNGDKPNKVLYLAMQKLSGRLQQVVTDFVRMEGSQADVIIIAPKS